MDVPFELETSLGFLVNQAAQRFRDALSRQLAELRLDVTVEEYRIIALLSDNHGLSQREIARRAIKEKTTLTRQLDQLARKGYIERTPDAADRRISRISLTPNGSKLRRRLQTAKQAVEKSSEASISAEELQGCKQALEQISANLSTLSKEGQPNSSK